MRLFKDDVQAQAVATALFIWPWVIAEICRLQMLRWRKKFNQSNIV